MVEMALQKITIGTILGIVMLSIVGSALGLLVATRTFSNTGNVKAIGVSVYWDSQCTNAVSSISWGALDAGTTKDVTIYVKNEGNVAVTLNMTTSNWDPQSAQSYMTLTWNRESYVLSAGTAIQTLLTLSVSSSVTGVTNFSFNIIITGTEHA